MPPSLFGLIRLAGLNVGLLIAILVLLAGLIVVAWRLLRVILVATFVLAVLPLALLSKALGLPREPKTEEHRDAREKIRKSAEQSIVRGLQLSDGGEYGRRRRLARSLESRKS